MSKRDSNDLIFERLQNIQPFLFTEKYIQHIFVITNMSTFPLSTLFHYPVLLALADGKEHCINELIKKTIEMLKISEEEQKVTLKDGTNKVSSWTNFAIRNLKDANLICTTAKRSGKYFITEKGKLLLTKKPNGFKGGTGKSLIALLNTLEISSEIEKADKSIPQEHPNSDTSTIEKIHDLATKINSSLPESLLVAVKQINPKSFEILIKKLLIAMGYGNTPEDVIVTQYSGDNGIDGYVRKDRLDIQKLCAYQAKRYTNANVGIVDMNALGGAMINCGTRCGIFVTTTDFTPQAMKYDPRGYSIIKINGKKLVELLIEYGIGVKCEKIEVKTADVDFLNNL